MFRKILFDDPHVADERTPNHALDLALPYILWSRHSYGNMYSCWLIDLHDNSGMIPALQEDCQKT
jgi:hypothetical protein